MENSSVQKRQRVELGPGIPLPRLERGDIIVINGVEELVTGGGDSWFISAQSTEIGTRIKDRKYDDYNKETGKFEYKNSKIAKGADGKIVGLNEVLEGVRR